MPVLYTNGDAFHDVTSTLAVMLWPGEQQEKERAQFFAAKYVDHVLRSTEEEVTLPANLLAALLDAPGWSALLEEVVKRTKRATVAGHVLVTMFVMDLCKERLPKRGDPGASLDKAIAVMEAWASMDKRFGNGSKFPLSDRTIRNYWDEFRSVAHLWAAKDLNLDPAFQFAPRQEVLNADNLHSLLCMAGQLAEFGCNFKLANKSRDKDRFLLDGGSIWWPDPTNHPPSMKVPKNLAIFDNSAFMQILRGYAA